MAPGRRCARKPQTHQPIHWNARYRVNTFSQPDLCPPDAASFRLLTEAERAASLQQSLLHWTAGSDIWVFGYGSLVWRPDFDFSEQRMALLHGYHRALCLWSRVNRGTPEKPGLVFGLDMGGSCRGMAFRIPAQDVPATLESLWRREMSSGAYIPKWLDLRTSQGSVKALVFTMNRNIDAYVRDLSKEQLIRIVQNAHGSYGPCIEYVLETAQALRLTGIRDKKLEALVLELQGALVENE
jgi:cation transport protein ChaC